VRRPPQLLLPWQYPRVAEATLRGALALQVRLTRGAGPMRTVPRPLGRSTADPVWAPLFRIERRWPLEKRGKSYLASVSYLPVTGVRAKSKAQSSCACNLPTMSRAVRLLSLSALSLFFGEQRTLSQFTSLPATAVHVAGQGDIGFAVRCPHHQR